MCKFNAKARATRNGPLGQGRGDVKRFGLYSVIKASPVGGMEDAKKLEFAETTAGRWVNAFTVWEQQALGELKQRKVAERAGEFQRSSIEEAIRDCVAAHTVVIFSFSACPWCVKAKATLTHLGVAYHSVELDDLGEDGPRVQSVLADLTSRTSMPCIYIRGTCIGGCMDGTPGLIPLIETGKLDQYLSM